MHLIEAYQTNKTKLNSLNLLAAISGSILDEEKAQRMMEQLGILNLPDPQAKVGYVTKDINKDFNEVSSKPAKNVLYNHKIK